MLTIDDAAHRKAKLAQQANWTANIPQDWSVKSSVQFDSSQAFNWTTAIGADLECAGLHTFAAEGSGAGATEVSGGRPPLPTGSSAEQLLDLQRRWQEALLQWTYPACPLPPSFAITAPARKPKDGGGGGSSGGIGGGGGSGSSAGGSGSGGGGGGASAAAATPAAQARAALFEADERYFVARQVKERVTH
jgi:uncharacterized membrane protein YgcG